METWGRADAAPATFTYERDAATSAVTALTLTCPGRRWNASPLEPRKPGYEAWVKWDLVRTYCSWTSRTGAQ